MDAILTLNIDKNVFENAEMYAKQTKKTVSQLVEEYLFSISSINKVDYKPLGPITKQLAGIMKLDKNVNYKDLLSDTLSEKYL